MAVQNLLDELKKLNVKLSVDGSNINASAPPGILTDTLIKRIRFYKKGLIEAVRIQPYMVIDYDPANLYGIMPANYQRLKDGTIRAIYRTRQEFTEHVLSAWWTKEEFDQAETLQDAAVVLGGVAKPKQGQLL